MAFVLLVTHRPSFAATWNEALQPTALPVRIVTPREAAHELARGVGSVVDFDSTSFPEAELIATVALARIYEAVSVAALGERALSVADDLLLQLSEGLVVREERERARVVSGFLRRLTAAHADASFAQLGHVPGRSELLAILHDGRALLCPRPVSEADPGGPIAQVALHDDALGAVVSVENGATFALNAQTLVADGGSSQGSATRESGPPDVDGVRLGQRLRALRMAAGLTQAELARRTGIHRPNIARVEAGRHTPSLETLARLAAAIGVSTTRVLAD